MMRESIQHVIDNVRPPRVQITYDVEIGNAVESRELPFVLGLMADLSGASEVVRPPLKERKFVDIASDMIPDVMASIRPRVNILVPNKLGGDAKEINVDLTFLTMDDFEPLQIVSQTPVLNDLYTTRTRLNDLLGKLEGNEALNKAMDEIITNKGANTDVPSLIQSTQMVRDPSQENYAGVLINEFITLVSKTDKAPADCVALVQQKIAELDATIGSQLNEILHHPDYQKLEGSWRGLWLLMTTTTQNAHIKIRLLNVTKTELILDLEKACEFDQSQLFKKVYEEEYGTFGGSPYSFLMGDFEFGRNPQETELLTKISQVAAAAHAPFISAANPNLFDLNSFSELGHPRDLSRIFDSTELGKWASFRETEDSRYVALTLPHILMRLPYGGENGQMVMGLNFIEDVDGTDNSKFCWGSSAWGLAQRILHAATEYGWPAAIRGVEGGGMVEDLPYYTFKTTDGDIALKCPTEISITDRREKELSDLGFIGLVHCKNRDYAAFFGAQTCQKPKLYNLDEANSNARLSARLSYILAASRFAHYIKVIMRDKVGSFMSRADVETYLNNWIASYVLLTDEASQPVKARYPLREARVDVYDVPGQPGSYRAVVFLRPHFQMEDLTASIRLVAALPKRAAG